MTELAYMVREDWAQHGTAMGAQSSVIRNWAGAPPYLFAVVDTTKVTADDRDADLQTIEFLAPDPSRRKLFDITELNRLEREHKVVAHAILAIHPFGVSQAEVIRRAIDAESIKRLFVMLWSPHDRIRNWLDARSAVNLASGDALNAPNPMMVEAARMMVSHEYNGLSSGGGKDAVVQLVLAFARAGYPIDVDSWLRAFYAAGGSFHHGDAISKLVGEMHAGTRHRVQPAYRNDILDIIQALVRAEGRASEGSADGLTAQSVV